MGSAVLAGLTAALVVAVPLVGSAPARAAAYRYWTYWTSDGSAGWRFSQQGPASTQPKDGAVEGWRFAVSTGTQGQGSQPRISPAAGFQQFCDTKTAPPGAKRVAVVFDFGTAADAPPGQDPPPARGVCVVIGADASGGRVLAEAADVRAQGGLICAIGGYPGGECAPAVAAPSPRPDEPGERRTHNQPDERQTNETDQTDRTDQPEQDNEPEPADPSEPKPDPEQRDRSPRQRAESGESWGAATTVGGTPLPPGTGVPTPLPATNATAAPVFTEAEARDAGNNSGPARALLAVAILAGLLGVFGWRRARRR